MGVLCFLNLASLGKKTDRELFWCFGLVLVVFAILRPIGIARDDLMYVEAFKAFCSSNSCAQVAEVRRDYVWNYLGKFGALWFPGEVRVLFVLSALGVLVKLFVIDKLCSNKLLALLLFVPLCYIQYDLTQIRAGFAIAWMMLAIYWIMQSKVYLGWGALLMNWGFHLQAIFSPGLLAYKIFENRPWIFPLCAFLFILFIFIGFYPDEKILKLIGFNSEYIPYGSSRPELRKYPLGYFLIVAYGIWLCSSQTQENCKIAQIVSSGLVIGVLVGWLFVSVPVMQTRIFEFYAVPLVLLAGNIGHSQLKIAVTSILAIVLYLRLELLHDWILG